MIIIFVHTFNFTNLVTLEVKTLPKPQSQLIKNNNLLNNISLTNIARRLLRMTLN